MTVYELCLFLPLWRGAGIQPEGLGYCPPPKRCRRAGTVPKTRLWILRCSDAFPAGKAVCRSLTAWFSRRLCIFIRRTTNLKFPPNWGSSARKQRAPLRNLYENTALVHARGIIAEEIVNRCYRPSELGRGLYRFLADCRFTAKDLRRRAETGNIALADHYQEDGLWRYAGLFPERKLRSVWRRDAAGI